MPNLRYFNEKGRSAWSDWLDALRNNPALAFPFELLEDVTFTRAAPGGAQLGPASESKFSLASSLVGPVSEAETKGLSIEHWPGLWDWLAAYYFDSLCPPKADGTRNVKALALYRLEDDFRRTYRHRICGPVSRVRHLGEHAKILLHGPPSTLTDWEEQAAARYETGGNPGIAEALCLLFWDEKTGKPKRGAAPNKRTPGTLRRFGEIMRQFALTYDLSAINAPGLLDLLPNEFEKWKPEAPA